MSRKKTLFAALIVCTSLSLFVAYSMAWMARDLKSFADHWAAFPNLMVALGLLTAGAICGVAAMEVK